MDKPVVVVGSGIAGLTVAHLVADFSPVTIVTKNSLFDSNTSISQGGIAAVWSERDSVDLHVQDTLNAGDGLCDETAVEVLSKESKNAIQTLIRLGTRFDQDDNHKYLLGLEGAHSTNRVLHAGGDATGAEIQRALVESVQNHPNITFLENCLAISILRNEKRVQGLQLFDRSQQIINDIDTSDLVIATGGAGQLFQYTSNPQGATGEGVVLAYLAGAFLMDMEFYQFHPTALSLPTAPNFLISEAIRGEGAILLNNEGKHFMEAVHPMKDLAPRDIVARAIASEMALSGKPVVLDATGIPSHYLEKRFPTILNTCFQYGIDIRKDSIPITPAAHYMIGGIATDLWGLTSIPGLYACGEVARTGVHGANRLASNSLLEAVVFAKRVALAIRDQRTCQLSFLPSTKADFYPNRNTNRDLDQWSLVKLQSLMWRNVGLVRNRQALTEAIHKMNDFSLSPLEKNKEDQFILSRMNLLGKIIAQSALQREESRGSHYREDFPQPSESRQTMYQQLAVP